MKPLEKEIDMEASDQKAGLKKGSYKPAMKKLSKTMLDNIEKDFNKYHDEVFAAVVYNSTEYELHSGDATAKNTAASVFEDRLNFTGHDMIPTHIVLSTYDKPYVKNKIKKIVKVLEIKPPKIDYRLKLKEIKF